jgi:MipA family protein
MKYMTPIAILVSLSWPVLASAELSNEILLGPGVRSRPAYDGSDSQRVELVPVVRYFNQSWFVRSTQGVLEGGPRFQLAPGLHAAAQLAYEAGRKSSDSDFLSSRAVASVSAGASMGAQLEWDQLIGPVPVSLLMRGRQHLGTHRGAQVDLRVSAGVFHSGPISIGLFAQSIWANSKSTNSLYGVNATQATASGLPAFGARSGWLSTSAGMLGSVELSPEWIVVGSADVRHLQGDAALSPLVEKRSNYSLSVGLARRF